MKKLYRSQRDKKIFGLCGGLAETLNVDSTMLRLIVVVCAFFSHGAVLLLYLIASMVIPKEPYGGDFGHFDADYTPPSQGTYTYGNTASSTPSYGPTGSTSSEFASGSGYGSVVNPVNPVNSTIQPAATNVDDMMKDLEKKSLQKELEELRAKLAQYEKGEKE